MFILLVVSWVNNAVVLIILGLIGGVRLTGRLGVIELTQEILKDR